MLVEPAQKIDELFSIFEESDQLRKIDPSFDDPKFDKHIVDTLISDLQQVVMVLRQNGRAQELPEVERQFMLAVDKSGHALLQKQVHAKAAFLFAGTDRRLQLQQRANARPTCLCSHQTGNATN